MNIDKPISKESEDKLGFGQIAEQLADALVEDALFEGFVIGVEGLWGSGKSSLINLALDRLRKRKQPTEIIKFSPWIVGNRNELLQQLFTEFKTVIIKKPNSKSFKIKSLLERYEKIVSPLASVAEVAEVFVPGIGMVTKGIKIAGETASKANQYSFSELRSQLRDELKGYEQRIVVFIDDIDRLEPSESVEVLRLIRAVADFPNVVYLLAYDAEVLASSLQRTIKVPDGKAYLEKIVQTSFKVPVPDRYDLRTWLRREIEKLVDISDIDDTSKAYLGTSIDIWCDRFISTPRDIVRVLNSIKLYVVPQKDRVYPADAVFLQIIRTKCPALYDWIEEYLLGLHSTNQAMSLAEMTSLSDSELESMGKSLTTMKANDRLDQVVSEIVGDDDDEKRRMIFQLRHHLPGLDLGLNAPRHGHEYSQTEVSEFSMECRLVSPYHSRLYFAFSVRSGEISDYEIREFLKLCVDDRPEAILRFRKISMQPRPQGGVMGAVLLARILDQGNLLLQDQIENLLLVLGDSIEELAHHSKPDFGYADFLRGEKNQIIGLIEHLDQERREKLLVTLFNNAPSWAWLSGIVRSSITQQGHFSFRKEPESDWLLTDSEFRLVRDIYVKRLKNENPRVLLKTPPPYFMYVLHAWYETDNEQDVIAWINHQSSSDSGFMDLLSKMTSWSRHSTMGVRYTIRTETLERYFPEMDVEKRLAGIENDARNPQMIREQATCLLAKLRDAIPILDSHSVQQTSQTMEDRLDELERKGVITTSDQPRRNFAAIVHRPGASQRFLDERNK